MKRPGLGNRRFGAIHFGFSLHRSFDPNLPLIEPPWNAAAPNRRRVALTWLFRHFRICALWPAMPESMLRVNQRRGCLSDSGAKGRKIILKLQRCGDNSPEREGGGRRESAPNAEQRCRRMRHTAVSAARRFPAERKQACQAVGPV